MRFVTSLGLSGLGTAVVAAYVGLFVLARGPATLRLRRLGSMLLAVAFLRVSALVAGLNVTGRTESVLMVSILVVGLLLLAAKRIWFFRIGAGTLRAQIDAACQRLFLPMEEPMPGRLQFTTKKRVRWLHMWPLGRRFLLAALPPVPDRDKVKLLLDWLSKQYPGPIPRIRIILKEEGS